MAEEPKVLSNCPKHLGNLWGGNPNHRQWVIGCNEAMVDKANFIIISTSPRNCKDNITWFSEHSNRFLLQDSWPHGFYSVRELVSQLPVSVICVFTKEVEYLLLWANPQDVWADFFISMQDDKISDKRLCTNKHFKDNSPL